MVTQDDDALNKLAESIPAEDATTNLSKMKFLNDDDIAEIESCLEVKTEKDSTGIDKDSPTLVAITSHNSDFSTLLHADCRVMLASNESDVTKLRAIMKLQATEYKKINPIILVYENIKEENEFDTKTELEKVFTNLDISFTSTSYSMLKENGNGNLLEGTKSIKKEILEGVLEKQEIRRMQSFVSLEDTLKKLADKSLYNATETGFKRFDEMLGGGVRDGRLYALGAISSLGKTTFALNIADNVAKADNVEKVGRDVLIFSLEMSRMEWHMKSLSRETYRIAKEKGMSAKEHAVPAMNLLTGKRELSDKQSDMITTATIQYTKTTSKRIYISEGIDNVGYKEIRDTIKKFMRVNTNSRPLVIIDYLQLMSSPEPKSRLLDKQIVDKNVLELKRMTRDFNLPIIVISSFNRDNYTTSASFQAFKESGAIEYSADVVIALELDVPADKGKATEEAINEAKNKNPRKVKLVILKNRFYKAWTTTFFNYHPAFDYFEEDERENTVEAEREKKEAKKENNECPF